MKKKQFHLLYCFSLLLACAPLSSAEIARHPAENSNEAIIAEKLEREKSDQYDLENEFYGETYSHSTEQNAQLFVNEAYRALPTYTTYHQGAWQLPAAVSGSGNHVFLANGSGWMIASSDASKTLKWVATDVIMVIPAPWYSSYNYVLYNGDTKDHVQANLKERPEGYNEHLYWVKATDAENGTLTLNDNSVWTVPYSYCRNQMRAWYPHQRVCIGINGADTWIDSFVTKKAPNILISLEPGLDGYIKAKCEY